MERTPGSRRLLLAAGLALALAGAPALAFAAAHKLNAPLALGGRVEPAERRDPALGRPLYPGYQISPDGGAVVFLADQSTADVVELYSAPLAGGAPVRLNAPLAPGGSVVEFAVGGGRVVYRADQRADEQLELFSVPLGGGEPVALSPFLTAAGDVTNFLLSPDGTSAVFRADRDDDERFDLFSAPLGGGPAVRLNDRASAVGDVQPDFAISPNNQRVVFRYDPYQAGVLGLFSAPLTGGAPPSSLSFGDVGLPGGPSALDFAIAPGGASVASRILDPVAGNVNLFLSPSSGPIAFFTNLSGLAAGASVEAPPPGELPDEDRVFLDDLPYAFTPDGADIIFIADPSDGLYQLHRVAASFAPGPPALLSNLIGGHEDVTNFRVSPDSSRIVYRADNADNRFELYTVQRGGGGETFLLSAPPAVGGDILEFAISPDGSRVIYRGDLGSDERFELGSSPIDRSSGAVVISGPLAPGGSVERFAIAQNGQRVVYSADQDLDGVVELYAVLLAGGTPARLNAPLVSGGDVHDFVLGAAGAVLFRADSVTDEVYNLLSVPLTGGAPVTLTDTGAISGDVRSFALTPDGAHAVYLADQGTDEVFELYGRALDEEGGPRRLSGPMGVGGDVQQFAVGPDGQRVIYIADQATDGVQELYSAPVEGGPAVKLNPPLPHGGNVLSARFSPDGRRALYVADHEAPLVFDLYSVAIEGGPAVRLSSLARDRALLGFDISPDGQRAVFIAQQRGAAHELFSVAVAGGTPVPLSGPLPEGGGIAAFAISPDGERVAFAGEQHSAGVTELYSVAIGGGEPVRLSPPLPPERDVYLGDACGGQGPPQQPGEGPPFLFSPDSRRVLYCADHDADEVLELYSAPVGGEAPAAKLNLPPGAGGGVRRFAISPDGAGVVFESLSIEAGAPQEQLYRAPIGGEALPTLLSGPPRPLAVIVAFAIGPDSATVVFTGDRDGAGQIALYAAGGGVEPVRRSGELVSGGNVSDFRISADGARVIYRADQRADEVQELFVGPLSGVGLTVPVSDRLAPGGDVQPAFALLPAGDRLVYLADQEIDGVDELFAAALPPPIRLHLPVLGAL
jgi:Tol biopolymer transport system component